MTRQIPWLRVIVEGIVIVASILLAFGLDSWWQGRQDREQGREYVLRLVDDLHADTLELARVARQWTAYEESGRTLLAFLRTGDLKDVDAATMLAHAVIATHDRSPYMESATYEELRSSGGLRLIDEPDLRDAIVGYHRALDSGVSFIERMDTGYERYVLSRVDPGFGSLVGQVCYRDDGGFNPCSPGVTGFDAPGTLDAMASDPTFLRLVNLRVSELAMARLLLARRLSASVETLRALEGAGG